MPDTNTMPPLHGIRVLELSTSPSAAYGGRLLAGLGAEVIWIEPPTGSPLRRSGGFPNDHPERDSGALTLHLQRGKQSLTLDLNTRAGQRLWRRLRPDIVLCDLSPAKWAAWGLEPQALLAADPSLIVTSITPYGASGPLQDWQATELTAYAAGGYLRITGEPDREPIKAWGTQAQLQAGIHAALGTAAALRTRARDGKGQHVDVSLAEAVSFLLGGTLQSAYFFDREPERNGTRLVGFGAGHAYPSTVRPCGDGFVHAHCNNRFPETLAVLFDEPRLAEPDLLQTMFGHADEIDTLMAPRLERTDRATIVREAQALRIPFTEVLRPSEVLEDEAGHHASREFLVRGVHPVAGAMTYPGAPIRLGAASWQDGVAPLLNADAALWDEAGETRARWRRAHVA
jgi:crotonobetainyl-CoA:carnitine CoA-transferase CaiB-like acyl-CoA transferase